MKQKLPIGKLTLSPHCSFSQDNRRGTQNPFCKISLRLRNQV